MDLNLYEIKYVYGSGRVAFHKRRVKQNLGDIEKRRLFFVFGHKFHLQFIGELLQQFPFFFTKVTLGFFFQHDQHIDGLLDGRQIGFGFSRFRVGDVAQVIKSR